MAIRAKIGDSTSPVVTKIIKGQPSIDDVSGINVNYETVEDGNVLGYDASSNTFTTVVALAADQGVFNNGSF